MPFHIRPFLTLPLTLWFLIPLLVLSSGPAYPEWVQIIKTEEGVTTYADPDTIRRKGNLVKMWELLDYETIQTVIRISFSSSKEQREFDCSAERVRMLAVTYFSGNMGRGKVVWSDSDEQKWHPVQPESVGQARWKFACGKQ